MESLTKATAAAAAAAAEKCSLSVVTTNKTWNGMNETKTKCTQNGHCGGQRTKKLPVVDWVLIKNKNKLQHLHMHQVNAPNAINKYRQMCTGHVHCPMRTHQMVCNFDFGSSTFCMQSGNKYVWMMTRRCGANRKWIHVFVFLLQLEIGNEKSGAKSEG